MDISIDAITKPVDNVVQKLNEIGNKVSSLRREITNDVMRQIPPPIDQSMVPKPQDIFMLTELVKNVGSDLQKLLKGIPSTADSVSNLNKNINKLDFKTLASVMQDTKNCDLPICDVINGIERVLDIEDCNDPNCKLFREIRDVLQSGNLAECDLYACKWIEDAISMINDPMGCDMEICRLVKEFVDINNLKTLLAGISQTAIDSIKKPIIIALSAIVITILVMFLMLLYLVFK
jgi:hypothetical protein